MTRAFVTGGAGFIGSSLVDRLLAEGCEVVAFDNFTTGQERFLGQAKRHPSFQLECGDTLDPAALTRAMADCDFVFHFAANADARAGLTDPSRDLQQNTIATFNVLEAMRANRIRRIAFASDGSVYGEADVVPTPENAPFPVQTSLHGASKLAGESMIAAYCQGFGFEASIFRFVSILGERYTHGHVFDFYKQLLAHPDYLEVLGDGTQRKSYLYLGDCLDAVLQVIRSAPDPDARHRAQIYNLGTFDYCHVRNSIAWISDRLGLKPELRFSGGKSGWVGDNPFIFLDTARIRATGWQPKLSIQQSVVRTVEWLMENQWVLAARE